MSQLRSALETATSRLRATAAQAVADGQLDDATKEKLRALGYKF